MPNLSTILQVILKFVFRAISVSVLGIAFILFGLQAVAPVYDFKAGTPFSGESLHNPYQGLDSTDFSTRIQRINLHAHHDPSGNIFESIYPYAPGEFEALYRDSGYSLALITDHQLINPLSPILGYEHGLNWSNYHIGVLGTQRVEWWNFPLMFRPRSQMQWIMNRLQGQSELLILNHPTRLRMGSRPDHLRTLRGYNLIENDHAGPHSVWDLILSNGYYPMMVCNDDAHFPYPTKRFMNGYTMAVADSVGGVFASLLRGTAFGVDIPPSDTIYRGIGSEPRFLHQKLRGDTIDVAFAAGVDSMQWIGQGGRLLQTTTGNSGEYVFGANDTYVRVEAYLEHRHRVILNPVARESALLRGEQLWSINIPLTIVNWVFWAIVCWGIFWLITLILGRGVRFLFWRGWRR